MLWLSQSRFSKDDEKKAASKELGEGHGDAWQAGPHCRKKRNDTL